jgi:acyl carrier protein
MSDLSPDAYGLVRTLLIEQFEADTAAVSAEASLADLGLDSLAVVELLDLLEERTRVTFENDEADEQLTVGTIAARIGDRFAAAGPP